jgi:TPR repeat protein
MTESISAMKTPSISPLYFSEKVQNCFGSCSPLLNLPAELLSHCLVDYLDWGDLAKLSTVHSTCADILMDAANHGGHAAKWELAQSMLEGTRGLDANPTRALQLLEELSGVIVNETSLEVNTNPSTTPFAPAIRKLAQCYLQGDGAEQHTTLGLAWLTAAFDLAQDLDAAHELAKLYEYGTYGVEIDMYAAAEYFGKAATGGHVEAMAEYAMCWELGCGVDQNDEQALEWYIRAANQGHVTSKYSVGEAFEEARGVPQSDEEACLWYYKAAILGDEDSKKALKRLHDIARIVLPGVSAVLEE